MKKKRPWPINSSIEELRGKTLVAIKRDDSHINYGESVFFATKEGDEYVMYHSQDCCESVWLEDVVGDLEDLLGNPLLVSEEVTNRNDPPLEGADESYTWTYYNMSTIKGGVQLRWFGSSNGYYSERADIYKITED